MIMLLGEGTFHQVHGGIATNAVGEGYAQAFRDEYARLRGHPFRRPQVQPWFFGQLDAAPVQSVRHSADHLASQRDARAAGGHAS